jgi:hypothetical protein
LLPPIPQRLLQIDEITVGKHFYLDASDQCFYVWEYTAGERYDFSPTNQRICKSSSRRRSQRIRSANTTNDARSRTPPRHFAASFRDRGPWQRSAWHFRRPLRSSRTSKSLNRFKSPSPPWFGKHIPTQVFVTCQPRPLHPLSLPRKVDARIAAIETTSLPPRGLGI